MLGHADTGRLGLLHDIPACTDLITKPWVQEAGVSVLNQPFFARDNVATAGGCLASQYLAFWLIARLEGLQAAQEAVHYVAPVGERGIPGSCATACVALPERHFLSLTNVMACLLMRPCAPLFCRAGPAVLSQPACG
jgi:hypothetical protein